MKWLAVLWIVTCGDAALARAGSPPDVYGVEPSPDRVLPVGGIDLPVATAVAGGDRLVSLAPPVQAIPTPTAFEAGSAAFAVAAVARLSRRRSV